MSPICDPSLFKTFSSRRQNRVCMATSRCLEFMRLHPMSI